MRRLCIALALAGLTACTTAPVDTGEARATIRITVDWTDFTGRDPETCAAAWVDTLWVMLEHGEGDVLQRQFACDNAVLEVADLRAGAWILQVQNHQDVLTAPSWYAQSDVVDLLLDPKDEQDITVEVACIEHGGSCDRTPDSGR
jgi:hypothetical protein